MIVAQDFYTKHKPPAPGPKWLQSFPIGQSAKGSKGTGKRSLKFCNGMLLYCNDFL